MLKVWRKAILMTAVIVLGPGIFVPALWRDWRIWWLFACAAVLVGSQPNIQYSKLGSDVKAVRDRGSIRLIIIAGYLSILLPLGKFILAVHNHEALRARSTAAAAAIVGSLALILRVYSIRVLGKFFTSHVVIQEDHQLCEAGPYRYVRHPSYSGSMLFFLMVPVVFGYPLWFFLYAVAWLLTYRRRIAAEEEALTEHFGEKYVQYKARTKALIPWVF
ncbi:MAG: isoprenylcysteine carboxylmethyltransferase family protein [Pseudomonadota bacterium]